MMRSAVFVSALAVIRAVGGQMPPAPIGKLVDIGGYHLHLYCTGKGSRTVVLSPGAGDFSFDWYLVQQKVSAFARVCSYDRPGNAWSDPGPQPRTMRQEAYELHVALQRSKERGPFVLVGHSLGGLSMRVFAQQYPDESGGLVLVDATSPDTTLSLNGKLVHMRELAKTRPIPDVQTVKTSSPKLLSDDERRKAINSRRPEIHGPYDRLPAEIQRLQLWAQSLPQAPQSVDYLPEELNQLYERSMATTHVLRDLPLVSIIGMIEEPRPNDVSQDKWDALFREKVDQKRAYRDLSTNSKVVEDRIAGHAVHLEDPETVMIAIRDVLNAVQRHTRLVP